MYRCSSISVTEASLTFLFLVLVSALALRSLAPPAAVPASAPPSDFSAERAMKHLDVIAREPHPTGSAANARVRDYLVDQLSSLGLKPEVQMAFAMTSWDIGAPYGTGIAESILARTSGTNSTGALLLMAHYDSVATGPGAGDNASGVLTVLETVRALRSSARLRNDVVFAFTDGEEDGGLGAQAFLDKHQWAKDLSIAVVVDGSGSCGPATMSVFDRHNGWLVRMFAKALPHPVAASISEALYKLAGAPTDEHLNLYQKNIPILDVGVDGCQTTYHTIEDKPANLDARSVQDLGNYELRLMRHFGSLDLKEKSQDDLIYFTLFGHVLFYPSKCVLPFAVVALLVLLSVLLLGFKRKILTRRGLALGFLLWVIGVTAAGGAMAFVAWVLLSMHLVSQSFISAYNAQLFAVAFLGFAAAMASAMYVALSQKIGTQNLVAGALLFCGALMIVTYALEPGATYLFTWPLLFALLPMSYAFALHRTDALPLRVLQLFCAVPAIALLVPLIGYMAMTTADVSQSLVIVGFLTMILFSMLAPQLEVLLERNKALLPGASALVALIFMLLGASRSGYDARHPKPDSMSYWLDAQAGKASWISFDEKPDDWTTQFLTSHPQADNVSIFGDVGGHAILKAQAPPLSLAAPAITTLDDSTVGDEHNVRLRVSSPRQARVLWVIVGNAAVLRAKLEGRNARVDEMDKRNKLWGFIFVGLPPQGITLDITVKTSESPQLIVTDQSDGLPEIPGFSAKPRSADRMPFPHVWPFFDTTTLVSRTTLIESNRSPSLDSR